VLLARPAWITVQLGAIAANVGQIRRQVGAHTAIMAIVKAHAYGHGSAPVAKAALAAGARLLGVTCLDEALELREAGITADILMLGYAPGWQASTIVANDIIVTAYDADLLEPLSAAALALDRPARVHLKVDTGMSRFGPLVADLCSLAGRAMQMPSLRIEGVFTHLATADSDDEGYAREQLVRFRSALRVLDTMNCHPRWRHAANSAAIGRLPESHFNLVRPGAALYGLNPSVGTPGPPTFQAALSLQCLVAQVKTIPTGTPVGYGATWVAERPTRLAVLQAGYADGIRRSPKPWGDTIIRGRRAPLVGAICMDLCMADVTDVPGVEAGDVAVMLGRQGNEEITVGEVACRLGTIGYEVLCGMASRVPRVYIPVGGAAPMATAVPLAGSPLRLGVESL
jgi:alanine racemase